MKYIFVSQTLPEEDRKVLSRFGSVVALPPLESLPSPIASHPDTLFALVGGRLFTFYDYTAGAELLEKLGVCVERVSVKAGRIYPLDAALNCFEVGGVTFGRESSLAAEVRLASGRLANVRQGYAHCSTAVFPNALISADDGIIAKAGELGIKTLKISSGSILLDGYDYGFIGGACAFADGKALFFGDLLSHPDGKRIGEFLLSQRIEPVSLSGHALTDCGSCLAADVK